MEGFWIHLPATLAAIGAIIATVLTHLKSSKQREKVTLQTKEQFQEQNVKLDVIHETTNSTLDTALRRIEALELIIAELKKGKPL